MNGILLGVIGGLIMQAGIVTKARLEEAWLRRQLGEGAYDAYAKRVSMLVPFARL